MEPERARGEMPVSCCMRSRHLFLPLVALSLSLATPGQRLSAQNARYVLTSVEQNIDVGNWQIGGRETGVAPGVARWRAASSIVVAQWYIILGDRNRTAGTARGTGKGMNGEPHPELDDKLCRTGGSNTTGGACRRLKHGG